MRLLIRVLTVNDQAPSAPITGVFSEGGGSLGRSDSNTLALPDPQRAISRLQAQVTFDQGRFWIQDVGAGVVTHVNAVPLPAGQRAPLKAHDAVQIGAYRLVVEEFDDDATRPGLPLRAGALSGATDPFAGLVPTAVQEQDPFADLFLQPRAAPVAPPPAPAKRAPTSASPFADLDVSGSGQSPSSHLPADFDPFADLSPRAPAPPPSGSNPFDLIGDDSNRPGAIDAAFGLPAATGRDPLAEFLGSSPSHEPGQSGDPFDVIRPGASASPGRAAMSDHTPELNAAYQPPKPVEAKPRPVAKAASPVQEPAPVAGTTASAPGAAPAVEELWRAFLEGAGLPPSFPQPPTPYLMRVIGQMLRYQTEGTLRLIATRAATKNALRAEVTLIHRRNNNPLKFSPNTRAALTQLLQPPAAGFLAAPEAVRDALDDIQSHLIGTMAGMRAALEDVFKRFEPSLLERRLTTQSTLDALVPAARRAKLWNLYLQHFEAIRDDAKESFQDMYAKAFVKAYEEQVERLRAASREEHR